MSRNWRFGAGAMFVALMAGIAGAQGASEAPGWVDRAKEATVAIGTIENCPEDYLGGKHTEDKCFKVVGTGVLLSPAEHGTVYLVTAKHVFLDPRHKWEPPAVQVRFSWFGEKPIHEYLGIWLPLKKGNETLWTPHPNADVDLAAIPLPFTPKEAGRASVPTLTPDAFPDAEDLYEGADVFVIGYPAAVGREYWTRALVRSGVVAWTNPTNPLENLLLVDAMIFPGNSGGPVFKSPGGVNRWGSLSVGGKVAFLGVITQGPIELAIVQDESTPQEARYVSFDRIGIGVVEPAARVRKLLEATVGGTPAK